jgi:hypothetical protein
MRHRLVVLAIVLAAAGLAGCGRDKDDRPDPQAQAPISITTLPSAASLPAGEPAAGASGGPSGGPGGGSATSAAPTDPAGAAIGRPQALPRGTDVKATGVGPYTIGQEQAALTTAKLIGPVRSGATGCDSGTGVSKWGSPTLFFTKGKLEHVKITSAAVATTAGIKVGSSEARVKAAYPKGSLTSGTAWYAPTGDFALLFRLAAGKVTVVEAGPASILETGSPNC